MDYTKMTLREKVLQTFIVTMREVNKHGGAKIFFKKHPVGGLFVSEHQKETEGKVETGTWTNVARIEECRKESTLPLLVCADWAKAEGEIYRVEFESVVGTDSEEMAYNYGKIVGMEFKDRGFDWWLGPCIDMLLDPAAPLFGWGDDPDTVIKICGAIVRGVRDQGVITCIKHFPGNGTSEVNMHFAPGKNNMPFDKWLETYGKTYTEIFKDGVNTVMTTHTTLESYDNEIHDGYYPIATYSEKLTQELLKEKMGFEGAVITDAMCMGGNGTSDLVKATAYAFKCGADFLLFPPIEAADKIVEMIESGEIPMSRLDDALARINRVRKFNERAKGPSVEKPDVDFINEMGKKIIKDGMCLLRNERGLIPIPSNAKKILIIDVADEGKNGANLLQAELENHGFSVDVKKDIYDVQSNICWQDDMDALCADYDRIIFNVNMKYSTAWSQPYMLIWSSHLVDMNKKIIINYGNPYLSTTAFPEDLTVIEANVKPNKFVAENLVNKMIGLDSFIGKSRFKHKKSTIKKFNK